MAIMGLDIGTTGAKAVVFDLEGKILSSSYREYNLHSPRPGWLELVPGEVLEAIRHVVGQACAKSPDRVKSVAMSQLGEAGVALGADMNPLANSIVGFDTRGDAECREFRETVDTQEVYQITGHTINSFHTLFKLLHLKRHEPGVFSRMRRFLCYEDYVTQQLGFEPTIGYSLAARTLLFDVNRCDWSDVLCERTGIDRTIFAKPGAPGTAVGTIGKNSLGFPEGAVLSVGLHDQPAGILGAGVAPGEAMLASGTVVCMGVLLDRPVDPTVMMKSNLCRYPTFGGNYISLAWNFTGGVALKWFRDQFAGDLVDEARRQGKDPYDLITAGLPEGPTKLLLLPYFTMTGTPYLDPRAGGVLMGLNLNTTRPQVARGIMEGITYELRFNQDLLGEAEVRIDRYKAIGGAAKSPFWMQLYADILDRPILILQTTECAAWGVALLGAHAAGLLNEPPDVRARKISRVGNQYSPRSEQVQAYNRRFELYREIYPKTKELLHWLDEIS